ncbi:GNAT family N-acetyltransferase [Paenibacillus pini]|uniref:Acetyltransferase n=1 Tax=Paenibacillus pini JCM 16418 TaxID=1236976 RepID=W7YCD3_9BACL|nr:GNAT family N-acetyltransferase [Paenibacillus pini]GAF06107.1 acetyltransferase [Paenibacillus pini JCM 16418]
MGHFKTMKFFDKHNQEFEIRSASPNDAQQILKYSQELFLSDSEPYLLTTTEEFNVTLEQECSWIESMEKKPGSIILMAEVQGEVVGLLDFNNGHKRRMVHTGEFGMSVRYDHRGRGIGKVLLRSLIDWATENPLIEKVNLDVFATNDRAISLYQSMGFIQESFRKNHIKLGDGEYIDLIGMGLILEKPGVISEKDFIIDCGDILLREYKVEDLDALCALTQQPEIKEFLPDWDVPKEQRLDWLINYETVDNQRFLEAVAKDGYVEDICLRLGIILKETGEFIGWCCSGMKEELPAPNREIMYAISAAHRNKGYVTQAVGGMMQYLFENTNVEQLNAIALIRNISSNRVIQKIRFEFVNTIKIDDESYNWYKFTKQTYIHMRDSTGFRSPSEQELISVLESNGYENKPFATKYYSDHAIAIGDHYACRVSMNIDNEMQYICDSW